VKGKVLFRNLAILIVIFLMFSSAGGIKKIKANDWYDTNWSYRIPVTINSSTALTDYQIKVVIDSSHSDFWNHVQSDAKDVRFTDSDGSTPFSYWIEKWDTTSGSESTTIWIKVPSIPNGTKTIYLYYGNSSATGNGWHTNPDGGGWYAGDGDNTFIFFDDFEGTSLNTDKWDSVTSSYTYTYWWWGWHTVTVDTGFIDVSGGQIHISSGSDIFGFGIIGGWAYIKSNDITDNEFVWETRYKATNRYDTRGINRNRIIVWGVTGVSDYGIFDNRWDHTTLQYYWNGWTGTSATLDSWMKSIESLSSNGSFFSWDVKDESGNSESDFPKSTSVTSSTNKNIVLQCGDSDHTGSINDPVGDLYADYVFVRKHTSNEPTTSLGGEEEPVDLSISKTVSSGPYYHGENVIFEITVTNTSSTQDATNVQVMDILPSGLSYISDDSSGSYDSGIWDIGTINAGESKTLHITAELDTLGNITNTATITSCDQGDPVSSNNSDGVTINVLPSADLELTKTILNPTTYVEEDIAYHIEVTNYGPDIAQDVVVTDVLPSGVDYKSHVASQGTYNSNTGKWDIGTLPNGSTVTLDITVRIEDYNPITNTATVTSDTTDPAPGNNTSSVTIDVEDPLIKGTVPREGYFEFFVDREGKRWLLRIPDKEYTTGWMPFDRLRATNTFMSGRYADRRFHLLFDWYSSGRCHLIFNDRRAGISIKFAGR